MPPNSTLAMRSPCDSYDSKIFPGIPRHTLASLSRDRIRNRRLPKRNPAVVGWNLAIEINCKPTISKSRNEPLQQIDILKGTAAKADEIQAVGVTKPPAYFNDDRDESVMKIRRH